MDASQWYAIAFGAMIALLVLRKVFVLLITFFAPRIWLIFAKFMAYPLLSPRSNWICITRWQAFLLCSYVSANLFALFILFQDVQNLQKRAAALALTNLCPLFYVGRTHPLADWLGVTMAVHLLGHRIMGAMALLHALVHVAIVLKLNPRASYVVYSGYLVSIHP